MNGKLLATLFSHALTVAIAAAVPAVHAATPDCAQALRFLDETMTVPLGAQGNQLAQQGPFKDWLNENSLAWDTLTDAAKNQALSTFYAGRLAVYNSADMPRLRAQSLAHELLHRGSSRPLPELSRENANRLLSEFFARYPIPGELKAGYPEAEIDKALAVLDLVYIHNTNSLVNRPAAPLLSAKELTSMGITTKLNTAPFNRLVLKTDGNLFFFAIPFLRSGPFPNVTSQYGDVSLILSPGFAESTGWVSPFVMYEDDLGELAERAFPQEWAVILDWLRAHDPAAFVKGAFPSDQALKAMPGEMWAPVVRRLHSLDMTPADITGLMRESLRHSLKRLWNTDKAAFDDALTRLKQGHDLGPLLEAYSLGQMGIPFGNASRALELKIPVSVPPGALDIRLSNDAIMYGQTSFGRILPIPKGPGLMRPHDEPPFY